MHLIHLLLFHFMFGFPVPKSLRKWVGSKFFPDSVHPFSEGKQTTLTELTTLKVNQFLLSAMSYLKQNLTNVSV